MKRKNLDSTHYKYDMYNPRPAKRFRSRPATRRPRTYTQMRTEHYIRPRTWSEYGRQVVGATAAGVGGFIAADAGLRTAVAAYEYLAPNLEVKKEFAEKKAMPTYGGNFNIKKDLSVATQMTDMYAKTGVVLNREVYGLVSDPDCCYVGHHTYDPSFYGFGIACAIVRKLLRKAGYNPTSLKEVVPTYGNYNSGNEKIQFCFTYINQDGSIGDAAPYIFGPTSSITNIVDGSNLAATIVDFFNSIAGNTIPAPFIIETVYLRIVDGSTTNSLGYLLASLNLKNEIVHMYSYSVLTLQNRTLNAVGAGTNTDDSSAQPLIGKRYLFSSAIPKMKEKGYVMEGTYNQGILLLRAGTGGGVVPPQWKEPPLQKEFSNCTTIGNVNLQPGEMKKGFISYSISGYLNNLYRRLASRSNGTGFGPLRDAPGTCEMFALEEMMATSSAVKVTVAYQKESRYCFDLKTGPSPNIAMDYTTINVDNLAP